MSTSQDANDFRYSFSGADCTATAFFPGGVVLSDAIDKASEKYDTYIARLQPRLAVLDEHKDKLEAAKTTLNSKITTAVAEARAGAGAEAGENAPEPTNNNIKALERKLKRVQDKLDKAEEEHGDVGASIAEARKHQNDLGKIKSKLASGEPAQLDSLATISISIHEPKGIARRLGYRNICGLARSVRTIAGTMIFTVVERHPLSQLMELDPQLIRPRGLKWMKDHIKGVGHWGQEGQSWIRTPTDLSPFNLLLTYMSEYSPVSSEGKIKGEMGSAANLMLENVEFMSNGFVTSVNDMVSEVTLQFVAGNIFELATPVQTSSSQSPISKLIEGYERDWRDLVAADVEGFDPDDPDKDDGSYEDLGIGDTKVLVEKPAPPPEEAIDKAASSK